VKAGRANVFEELLMRSTKVDAISLAYVESGEAWKWQELAEYDARKGQQRSSPRAMVPDLIGSKESNREE
jgi:hypothetical protein